MARRSLAVGSTGTPVASGPGVLTFAAGLVLGLAVGLIVIGFLAIAAYQHGYEEASGKRRHWRAELVARKAAVRAATAAVRKAG